MKFVLTGLNTGFIEATVCKGRFYPCRIPEMSKLLISPSPDVIVPSGFPRLRGHQLIRVLLPDPLPRLYSSHLGDDLPKVCVVLVR